jgi:hypothetical protein
VSVTASAFLTGAQFSVQKAHKVWYSKGESDFYHFYPPCTKGRVCGPFFFCGICYSAFGAIMLGIDFMA